MMVKHRLRNQSIKQKSDSFYLTIGEMNVSRLNCALRLFLFGD